MIKALVSFTLSIVIVFLLKRYIKDFKSFESEKDNLFDFLYKKNEYEALRKLGAINPFGVREKWHLSSRKIREYLVGRKDLSDQEEVKKFINKMNLFDRSFVLNLVTSFVLMFVLILLYSN